MLLQSAGIAIQEIPDRRVLGGWNQGLFAMPRGCAKWIECTVYWPLTYIFIDTLGQPHDCIAQWW